MASTEDRIRTLLAENLEVDGKPLPQPVDFSVGLAEVWSFVYGNRGFREGRRPGVRRRVYARNLRGAQ
jgi:hypothetical protein